MFAFGVEWQGLQSCKGWLLAIVFRMCPEGCLMLDQDVGRFPRSTTGPLPGELLMPRRVMETIFR